MTTIKVMSTGAMESMVEALGHEFERTSTAAVQAYLGEARMAKQFWPERIEIVADLPRTASGKIQKFKLRELATAFAEAK